jgi:membrane protein DedA with SNARE-associated domain
MALNSSNLLPILQTHGYVLFFLLMLVEGPVVTYAGAYAASLGFFNVYIIFILAAAGGILQANIVFLIGRIARGRTIEKILSHFGLKKSRIIFIEQGVRKHTVKSIILAKLTPGLAIPGLLAAGFMRVQFRKFFFIDAIIDTLGAIIFTLSGFYSGIVTINLLKLYKLEGFMVLPFLVLVVAIYFLVRWFQQKLEKTT